MVTIAYILITSGRPRDYERDAATILDFLVQLILVVIMFSIGGN